MFNLIVFGLLIIETIIIWFYYKWTNERKEIEIDTYKKSVTDLREIIKTKNKIIKEFQNESKRKNNK